MGYNGWIKVIKVKCWHSNRDLKMRELRMPTSLVGKNIPERRQLVQRPWDGHALACKTNSKELGVARAQSERIEP